MKFELPTFTQAKINSANVRSEKHGPDLGINRNFWNGGSEIAASCAASITARGNP